MFALHHLTICLRAMPVCSGHGRKVQRPYGAKGKCIMFNLFNRLKDMRASGKITGTDTVKLQSGHSAKTGKPQYKAILVSEEPLTDPANIVEWSKTADVKSISTTYTAGNGQVTSKFSPSVDVATELACEAFGVPFSPSVDAVPPTTRNGVIDAALAGS
jgi:hypothetical protein